MRTDVKVGLVCVFAVVLAVVCYFTLHDKNRNTVVSTGANTPAAGAEAPAAGSGNLNLATPPTTAPAAASNDVASAPTFASNTGGGSLLGPSAAYGQVSPPSNSLGGTIIQPPGAATAPSGTGLMNATPASGSTVGLTPPGSMNTPLVPSPGLTAPGGLSSPGLGSPGLSTAPLMPSSSTETPGTTSILPPASPFSTPSTLTTGTTGKSSKSGKGRKGAAATVDVMTPSSGSSMDILSGNTTSGSALLGAGGSYAIQKGDMLGAIAKRNGVTLKALLAANPGVNPNRMKVGQKVNIPAASATPATEPASSKRDGTTPGSSKKAKSATTHPAANTGGTYTVKKGDTLRKIAKAVYGEESMWQRIFRANRGDLASPNDITVGEVIKLPATK